MPLRQLIVVLICTCAHAQQPGHVELTPITLHTSEGESIDAERGTLWVTENRHDHDSRVIALAFVRLKSVADDARAPLVHLAGGPGDSSTHMADSPGALTAFRPILDVCDVIFFDQRGTGASEPDMRVPIDVRLSDVLFLDEDQAMARTREIGTQAAASLSQRGIDIRGYTTEQNADDLNDLRIALDEDHLSLLGFSYGTHLAQAMMRRHGDHLQSVVVCGVEGLDETYKDPMRADTQLRKLALMASADPQINQSIPDLIMLLRRVLARLQREPMVVQAQGPEGMIDVPVGPFGLMLIMRFDIGDATDLPVIPRLLWSIDRGDPSVLRWFVQKRLGIVRGLNGMTILMDGTSGASEGRWALVSAETERSLFGKAVNFPFPDAFDAMNVQTLPDDFREPLVSDVRTLLLSGSLDWNTPPYQAEKLRWGLTDSTHIIVDNAGHEQVLSHPDVQRAVVRFLGGDDVSDVRAAWPALTFEPLEGPGSHPATR